jgi:hypothetical protein
MRLYDVAVASLAIGSPLKWTDNLLAHHAIPEVRSRTRGVARGISWVGLVRIALIRELHLALGCGVREAVALSDLMLRAPDGVLAPSPFLTLGFDRRALEENLHRRLAETLESAPRPRRGRPARRLTNAGGERGGEREAGRL